MEKRWCFYLHSMRSYAIISKLCFIFSDSIPIVTPFLAWSWVFSWWQSPGRCFTSKFPRMSRALSFSVRFWLTLGFLSISAIPIIACIETNRFSRKELFFASPVLAPNGTVFIRKDSYGKGHFGASRNGGRTHKGVDLISPLGRAVLAAKSGRVIAAVQDTGYGNYIELLHPGGLTTRYAHLGRLFAAKGDWVIRNQVIGQSGKTGNADHPNITPHLHFEIRFHNGALNPVRSGLDPSLRILPA